MRLQIVTPAAYEPLTLAEVKDHLRIEPTTVDQDSLLQGLIVAARDHVEKTTGRALIAQTWDLFLDAFPREIEVPRPPLRSVTSIAYVDAAGATQTLAADRYQVDAAARDYPGRIRPAVTYSWPGTRSSTYNAVTVRFVAGFGADWSAVPAAIRQAMLLAIGTWYDQAEDVVVGATVARLPLAVDALLAPWRVAAI